jgi:hypothetical protein
LPDAERVTARTGGSNYISGSSTKNASTVTITLVSKDKRKNATKDVAENKELPQKI